MTAREAEVVEVVRTHAVVSATVAVVQRDRTIRDQEASHAAHEAVATLEDPGAGLEVRTSVQSRTQDVVVEQVLRQILVLRIVERAPHAGRDRGAVGVHDVVFGRTAGALETRPG